MGALAAPPWSVWSIAAVATAGVILRPFARPLSGPSYAYRGAVIDCQKGGHVCVLQMPAPRSTAVALAW